MEGMGTQVSPSTHHDMKHMRLSAGQIAFSDDGDTAYVVAEGGCLHCGPRIAWHHEMDCGNTPLMAPTWMTSTCETCGGGQLIWKSRWQRVKAFPDSATDRCPDCRNGKPIQTFDVECPMCDGTGHFGGKGSYYDHPDHPDGKPCRSCKRGTISYRLVVREVLPIVTTPKLGPHSEPYPIPCVDVTDAQPMLWRHHDAGFKPITLPPAAKPGMYLAICGVVP